MIINLGICLRVKDVKKPLANSIKERCCDCKEEVWVGKDMVELEPPYPIRDKICVVCFNKHLNR